MSKFAAFIVLILLAGIIGTVYYQNSSDLGVKIERLKLKHAIGINSSAESIMTFSEDLDSISLVSSNDKKILDFEQKYWMALAMNKKTLKYFQINKGIFSYDCSNPEIIDLISTSDDAVDLGNVLDSRYALAENEYNVDEQKEWNIKIETLKTSIAENNDLLYVVCPIN